MGPESVDDPGASWKYPGAQSPENPRSHEDDAVGTWKCLGPDPVPLHRNSPAPMPARPVVAVFSVVGFVCAAIALVSCVWLLGPIGVVLGVVGHIRGERLGKWAALAAAAATAVALVMVFDVAPRR